MSTCNIWDLPILKNCLMFIWNSNLTGHPVFHLATLFVENFKTIVKLPKTWYAFYYHHTPAIQNTVSDRILLSGGWASLYHPPSTHLDSSPPKLFSRMSVSMRCWNIWKMPTIHPFPASMLRCLHQEVESNFSKDIPMSKRHMQRCSASLIIREMQVKTTVRCHLKMPSVKSLQTINPEGALEIRVPSSCWWM